MGQITYPPLANSFIYSLSNHALIIQGDGIALKCAEANTQIHHHTLKCSCFCAIKPPSNTQKCLILAGFLPFVCEEESVHFPLPPFQLELSGPNDQPNDPSERVGHVRRGGMGISCG